MDLLLHSIFHVISFSVQIADKMSDSDASLASIFEEAKSQNSQLDQLDTLESSYKEALQKTISLLEKCQDLIQKGGVFSRNETVEDITTSSLQ